MVDFNLGKYASPMDPLGLWGLGLQLVDPHEMPKVGKCACNLALFLGKIQISISSEWDF